MTVRVFIFAIVFALLPCANALGEVGRGEFESIEKVARYILSQFPKGEYLYVGVGRSPTPIMAYLQTEEGTRVLNLPLTNFRHGVNGKPELSSEETAKLFQHFDEYIPRAIAVSRRKKILLVDFTFGGSTLASADLYLHKYLEANHREMPIDMLGLATRSDARNLKRAFPNMNVLPLRYSDTDPFDVKKNDHLLMKMASRLYLEKSEYPGFSLESPASSSPPRPEYAAYVEEVRTARKNYSKGLLNDDWISAYSDLNHESKLVSPVHREEVEEIRALEQERIAGLIKDDVFTARFNQIISRVARSRCVQQILGPLFGP